MAFTPFPKMPRLFRDCVITEKIDGTNAQVLIVDMSVDPSPLIELEPHIIAQKPGLIMLAGSRTKFIKPGKQTDNAGFAGWVASHSDELFELGPGQHFGEWYGAKIQRGYGLDHKRFALFNTHKFSEVRPSCCDVVPVLYRGPFDTLHVVNAIRRLQDLGSVAVPGYMDPEGIIVFHEAANHGFKVTCKDDEKPKGQVRG